MRPLLLAMTVLLCVAVRPLLAQQTHAQLLSQVQAADMLSDLLTWTGQRAETRLATYNAFLKEINKLDDFNRTRTPPPKVASLPYAILFQGAVDFINSGGGQYADPAFKKLNDTQLLSELNALQIYNIQQFVARDEISQSVAEHQKYVESIGQTDAYNQWMKKHAPQLIVPPPATTQPEALTPQQIVERTAGLVKVARAAAWEHAQAHGMTQADFDRQWAQKVDQFRADVDKRVAGMAQLSARYNSLPPPRTPAKSTIPSGPQGQPINGWVPPDANFNNSDDPSRDAFDNTYKGPGLYGYYDPRINDEYDRRVNGEYDRRSGLDFDRRVNLQLVIRQGV
jgi:hypothetical protein